MKQYLIYAGLFVASLLVINVGMYFFLHSTQPEPELAMNEAADSTGAVVDSALVLEPANIDSTVAMASDSTQELHSELAEALSGEKTAPVDSASNEKTILSATEEQATEAASPELEQQEVDPSASLAYNESDYDTPAIEPADIPTEILPQANPKELTKLAKLLEGMKPAEAAAIASRLGTEEIVALVMKMKDRKAAKMMAELPVDRAAQVAERMSEIIAQRGVKS